MPALKKEKTAFKPVKAHGLTDVPGFESAGAACGIRGKNDGRLDVALIVSRKPCKVAGVFTKNAVPAAPVHLCREVLAARTPVHGIVVNSGNANAWTGPSGMKDAFGMQVLAGKSCGLDPQSFLVCSTGRIGRKLPMSNIRRGIEKAASSLGTTRKHGLSAARAILTSDTREKVVTVRIPWKEKILTVSGIAKGAGMIEPNMATMLAFIATDTAASTLLLRGVLKQSVDRSFNAITVDGDMSTNDTVLLLANGHSGVRVTPANKGLLELFSKAVEHVCRELAGKIVSDGEKITKVVEITVKGAKAKGEAEKIARAIGNSLLVKTSWYGSDPNWGRLMDAAGYAGATIIEDKVDLLYAPYPSGRPIIVLKNGNVRDSNEARWRKIVAPKRFKIILDLNLGRDEFSLLSTDLTEGYVDFNKSE